MYKRIDDNNVIFNDSEFQKDKYKFSIIFKNLSSPELELYSDEENYIICRGSKKRPTWIWTKDNFDKAKISEIEELIKMISRRDSISEEEAREVVQVAAVDMETAFYNGNLGLAEEILRSDLGLEPDYLMLFIN